MENLEEYLNSVGPKGSIKRLETIAPMNLGERSIAAGRACEKRYRRQDLMGMGISQENAILIVNREYNQ